MNDLTGFCYGFPLRDGVWAFWQGSEEREAGLGWRWDFARAGLVCGLERARARARYDCGVFFMGSRFGMDAWMHGCMYRVSQVERGVEIVAPYLLSTRVENTWRGFLVRVGFGKYVGLIH